MMGTESPDTSDKGIEALVKPLGMLAPRVSIEDVEANIVHVEYVRHDTHGGQVLRWAVITTRSGFAVTGRPSAAVSPENDRRLLGEALALKNARDELWAHMAYALKEKLSNG